MQRLSQGVLHSMRSTLILLLVLSIWNPLQLLAETPNHSSEESSYGLYVRCPDDVIVACGDHYYDELPLPEVHTDCDYCHGDYISGFIYMGSWNGHSYYCSKDKMTWQDAKAFCNDKGGYLAVVSSSEENHFLANLLQADAAFIGLSDHEQEGHWKWVNQEPVNYSNWYYNQPNNYHGKQHYVELLKNGYWNDQYYYKKLEFIMELPCYSITKTKDKYTYSGSHKKRHIEYKVKDACGNVKWCDYYIVYDQDSKLTCPSNIEAVTNSGTSFITWNPPIYETCCTDCSHDDYLPGYIYMGSWKGSKYYCSKKKYTWIEAKERCTRDGGYLAIVNDEEENEFLASKLQADYAYIGVSDHVNEGKWMTVNNSPCTYFNWYPGEPDNTWGKQHYVEMNRHGYWNDQYKEKKREYIMEVPDCQQVYQIEGPRPGTHIPVGHHRVTYKAKDGCGNEDYCSFYVTVKPEHYEPSYCEIWAKRTDKGYIDRVSLNNKWFISGSNGGYYYHEKYCVNVYQGHYLYVKLRPGYAHHYNKAYWKIYIDRNQDGDFEDSYEYIAKGSGYGTLSAKIPIPQHVKPGKTRLRVIMKIGGYPSYTCGKYEFGETEDFCIYVRDHKSVSKEGKSGESFDPIELTADAPEIVSEGLEVFPNPATDRVVVRITGLSGTQSVRIVNMAGQVVKEIRVPIREEISLDLSDIHPGIYMVTALDETDKIHYKKLVIQ